MANSKLLRLLIIAVAFSKDFPIAASLVHFNLFLSWILIIDCKM